MYIIYKIKIAWTTVLIYSKPLPCRPAATVPLFCN